MQQNFTHGRSKTVAVEVRKTRTFAPGASGSLVEVRQSGDADSKWEDALRGLTEGEREARLRALKLAEAQGKAQAERQAELSKAKKQAGR